MIEEKRQRQLQWGCEFIGRQRHALRGAAAPCELRRDSAERCVTGQRRALWERFKFWTRRVIVSCKRRRWGINDNYRKLA